ncbi:hypothetical protein ACE6H2_021190 [Prunus campanulata]
MSSLAYNITMKMVARKRYYGDDDVADKEEARQFIEIMEQAVAYTTLPKPGDIFQWINIFCGGSGTETLEWAMSNLLNHSHVLKKARVELDGQVGQTTLLIKYHLRDSPVVSTGPTTSTTFFIPRLHNWRIRSVTWHDEDLKTVRICRTNSFRLDLEGGLALERAWRNVW